MGNSLALFAFLAGLRHLPCNKHFYPWYQTLARPPRGTSMPNIGDDESVNLVVAQRHEQGTDQVQKEASYCQRSTRNLSAQ